MSKKSARSKGYRSYKTEQKGFTKGELRALIIGFVVLVLAIAAVIYLPDAIENSHLVKVKDGEFIGAEDNWLIINTSDTSTKKYRKIAEVNPVEGYTSESFASSSTDLSRSFNFTAEDENAVVSSYTVSGNDSEYKSCAEGVLSNFSTNVALYGMTPISIADEMSTCEVNGHTLYWFESAYSYDETVTAETDETADEDAATDETAEETAAQTVTHYIQNVYMYAPSDVDGMCVILAVSNDYASEEEFGDVGEIVAFLQTAAAQISSLQ